MQNKQTLISLVNRAERGVLLPGEAQILRDAIEMLDDMCMCMDSVMTRSTAESIHPGFETSTTQTFRAISDDAQSVSNGERLSGYTDIHFSDDSGCP
jgi:hypothetical protein